MDAIAGGSNELFQSLEKCLLDEYNIKDAAPYIRVIIGKGKTYRCSSRGQKQLESRLAQPPMDRFVETYKPDLYICALSEEVRNLEQVSRQIATILQAIHQTTDDSGTLELCAKARGHFQDVQRCYKNIAQKVPEGDYYKYLSQWQNVSNRLCFLASLVVFLETGSLAQRHDVMNMLGVQIDRKKGFHVDLEDYLFGLLSLVNELSRLAVNSVICGNYTRPVKISKFVSDLESGFRLLNLKNDFLRKKYDGLKYDVKKIEQVVYDLKIRGLIADLPGE